MFDKAQVMEFKDAFSIMDTNSDGLVDVNDLKITFERLGTVLFFLHNRTQKKLTWSKLFRSTCHNKGN